MDDDKVFLVALFLLLCAALIASFYLEDKIEDQVITSPEYQAGYEDYPDNTLYDQLRQQIREEGTFSPLDEKMLYCRGFENAKDDALEIEFDSRMDK